MSDPLETQLGEEIAARLNVVALLDPAIARAALAGVRLAARGWVQTLGDDTKAWTHAPDIYDALWPNGAPLEWWTTPLGRLLATAGVVPEGTVSQRAASETLGWSRHKVARILGPAPIKLRDVLRQLD